MLYTGVGSRETPPEFIDLIRDIAKQLASSGCIVRSGAAEGADKAFEEGADAVRGKKEIYLPWRGFNNSVSSLFGVNEQALKIAATVHPAWGILRDGPKKLHGRNVYQVLGSNLSTV